jgi:type II secretory ATPase GspE/PulE/Tfp pilus assembly ATPase PilB-like protein
MTGYTGQHAVFELMTMSMSIRQALLRGGSSVEIEDIARREGMRSLIEDGWRLAGANLTQPKCFRFQKESEEGLNAPV